LDLSEYATQNICLLFINQIVSFLPFYAQERTRLKRAIYRIYSIASRTWPKPQYFMYNHVSRLFVTLVMILHHYNCPLFIIIPPVTECARGAEEKKDNW